MLVLSTANTASAFPLFRRMAFAAVLLLVAACA